MISYEDFKNIFDNKIFAKSKLDLLDKVSKNPDRYVGIFRPTKPYAKLLPNLLKSNEIRFGDALEFAIEKYFQNEDWQVLQKNISLFNSQEQLRIDQLLKKDNQILFIEQKIRDDHDSSKKRGQIANFEKKLEAISYQYPNNEIKGFFYFIDPSLVKNKGFYESELNKLQKAYGITLYVCYGKELFESIGLIAIWNDIIINLEKWRKTIPTLPEINFDINPNSSFNEIKDLPLNIYRKIFDDERIVEQILPIIFPNGKTLQLLLEHISQQTKPIAQNISSKIKNYLENRH